MKSLPSLLLLTLALTLPALAVPLRVLPWDREISERKLTIAHGEKDQEIPYMHPDARSEPLNVPISAEAGLRLMVHDRTNDEGVSASLPITIPAGVKRPLLLLLPNKKSVTGLRALVLDDDLQSFRWGTIRLINVTNEKLVFRWGEKNARSLNPGWKPTDVSPGGNDRNLEVFLYHRTNAKKPLYSAVWEHRDDMRQLVFVVPNPDPALGPVDFKFVPETRLPAPVE